MSKLSKPATWLDWLEARIEAIWTNLQTNNLWQRMFKNTLATTLAVILALTPAVVDRYGRATYLAAITTVFGHPGRRFGMMAEALVLAVAGTLLGTAWSTFGIYLSSLVYDFDSAAAYTIRGLFLSVALLLHGFFRSHTPRLFIFVLLLVIVSVVSLTGPATVVSSTLATALMYPILTATGILLLVNICIFPEFSSSFLGITTIETLGESVGALRDAGCYFVAVVESANNEVANPSRPTEERHSSEVGPLEALHRHGTTAAEPPVGPHESDKTLVIVRRFLRILKKKEAHEAIGEEKVKPGNDAQSSDTKKEEQKAKSSNDDAAKGIKTVKLKSLTDKKAKLRSKLDSCKSVQEECNFELAVAVLPPRDLKPISVTAMKKLVANTIALIGACESKYALLGDVDDVDIKEKQTEEATSEKGHVTAPEGASSMDNLPSQDESSADEKDHKKHRKFSRRRKDKSRKQREAEELEMVKPRKEIEFGDVELLKFLLSRIKDPLVDLQEKVDRTVDAITSCLAYCYDVKKLPSGAKAPKGIEIEEIDIRLNILTDAIADFDKNTAAALESSIAVQDVSMPQVDIMPRMETFLISSFLLNLRQAALHTHDMLSHARSLVEKRQARHGRRRIYAPRINWRKWLNSGGEEDQMALPNSARKDARTGMGENASDESRPTESKESFVKKSRTDEESLPEPKGPPELSTLPHTSTPRLTKKPSITSRIRNIVADATEYTLASDDVAYAMKLVIAVMLVTWPAFVGNWNQWYYANRGLWAALQLVLITEVAIGNSVRVFILRACGTTLGCVWGYAAYQAGAKYSSPVTSRVICVILLVIGIIPSTYIQLGSKYVKAGMVSIISMCIVTLATFDVTVPGTATENFLRRWIAFLIGGTVALVVEVVVFPVKARDRLVESLAASIRQVSEMEACLAYGIETERNVNVNSPEVSERFEDAKAKAQRALAAAETFLPFTAQEPRLKGSFAALALVYEEILYVLHQIVDKMDNMFQLRKEYGSGVLEELNTHVFAYRRNVAGSITLILFAVHEALTTKLPLPQFLPSARLAHLRMVNRVREVVLSNDSMAGKVYEDDTDHLRESKRPQIELAMVKRIVRRKFLSWNAASAGQIEVIEYLEELTDLAKLLVGANEFRSGMLTRPTYREYTERISKALEVEMLGNETLDEDVLKREELRDTFSDTPKVGITKRRTHAQSGTVKSEELPVPSKLPSNSEAAERIKEAEEEQLPFALQRVRSRRIEQRKEWYGRVRSRSGGEYQWTSGRER